MVMMFKDLEEPPILWSIPFTLLLVTLFVAAADMLLPFIRLDVGLQAWMWAASTLITTIAASLVTEIISADKRRAMISMVFSAVVFSLIYRDLSGVVQKSIIEAVQGAVPNPLLGTAVYATSLTVVPSVLTGIILGGIFGSFPNAPPKPETSPIAIPIPEPVEPRLPGYEKLCGRCGHHAPYVSKYCPYCGIELTMRRAPTVQYCRFCGARINYLGQFCPDCGKEIDIVSKPQIFVSQ